ncbi:MAG: tryptophan synthase subunit beta [Promethearchaeota archaeon]
MKKLNYFGKFPDKDGRFGRFGGRYVPETLMPAINELEDQYMQYRDDAAFKSELEEIRSSYTGRPTPLTYVRHLSEEFGCKIYLKREDLVHGGAHKLNNVMGQALLARKMGKKKLIAETGAGQHGFATAIAGAYFGMETKIFMGAIDMVRQKYNVYRMRLLGAEVIPVHSGAKTLKEATSEALRYWTAHVSDTYYLIGSVVGPHPYPMIVRDFQSVIGKEIREQLIEKEERLPRAIVACIGGGSNAIGSFYSFIEDMEVELWGVEAAGKGADLFENALALNKGTEGILHGARELLLQDEDGNVRESYSISAGLDYPGVGPELCYLKEIGRLSLGYATDDESLSAFKTLARLEGIIPALESSHAIAWARKLARNFERDDIMVINLSGHGGKDLDVALKSLGMMK